MQIVSNVSEAWLCPTEHTGADLKPVWVRPMRGRADWQTPGSLTSFCCDCFSYKQILHDPGNRLILNWCIIHTSPGNKLWRHLRRSNSLLYMWFDHLLVRKANLHTEGVYALVFTWRMKSWLNIWFCRTAYHHFSRIGLYLDDCTSYAKTITP